jgi:hypothetical protein
MKKKNKIHYFFAFTFFRSAYEMKVRGNCTFCTPTRIFPALGHLPLPPLHNAGITTVPNPQTTWWREGSDRMAKGRKTLGFLSWLHPIKRGQGQTLSLLFWNVLKDIIFNDKNFFSAGKFRIFEIKIFKSRN